MIFIIRYVELYNIQNYKNVTRYQLSSKVTIFSGRNSTGKTAIRLAMMLFAKHHSDLELRGILRRGVDIGYSMLYLDTGYVLRATLKRVKKKNKPDHIDILYEYIRLADNRVVNKWNMHSDEILRILKWVKFETKDDTIFLNFKCSGSHLLVDTPGTINTMTVNSLCYNEKYERKIVNLTDAVKKEENIIEKIGQDARIIASRLKECKYVDITSMTEIKNYYEELKLNLKTLSNLYRTYTSASAYYTIRNRLNYLKMILECVKIEKIKLYLATTVAQKELCDRLTYLKKVLCYARIKKHMQNIKSLQQSLDNKQLLLLKIQAMMSDVKLKSFLSQNINSLENYENINQVQKITSNAVALKSLTMVTNLRKRDHILNTLLNFSRQILPKISLKYYEKIAQNRVKYQLLYSIIGLRKSFNQSSRILLLYKKRNNKQKNSVFIQEIGFNLLVFLYLKKYQYFLNRLASISNVTENIPTCPTCGKAYKQLKEEHIC